MFVGPLIRVLEELSAVITRLTDAQYQQSPVGVFGSSIGGHTRHCLDHVRAIIGATHSGELDYDQRNRGTDVETSRQAALTVAEGLMAELSQLRAGQAHHDLRLQMLLTRDGQPVIVRTSLERELAYVLAHTIHHNALISAMLQTLGAWRPQTFGYAPATLQHAEKTACVQSA